MWRYHGDAQVEEAVTEADWALEAVQGFGCDTILHGCIVVGVVCWEGVLVPRGPPLIGVLQLADVAVALIVHFPSLTENPASFDIRCQWKQEIRYFGGRSAPTCWGGRTNPETQKTTIKNSKSSVMVLNLLLIYLTDCNNPSMKVSLRPDYKFLPFTQYLTLLSAKLCQFQTRNNYTSFSLL